MSDAPVRYCRECRTHRLSVADEGDVCYFCRYPVLVTRARAREFCKCGRRKTRPTMSYCRDCQNAYNRRRRGREAGGAERKDYQ